MERIQLHSKEIYDGATDVTLELFVHQSSPELTKAPRPAMLVLPGGGYAFCSDREAEPIASAYFSIGYNCFVLRYITGERAKIRNPLYDAAAAIAHIRTNAEKYCIDVNRIAVIGFSAGGHLAGLIATQWHYPEIAQKLGTESNELFRPNAAILGYPVVSLNCCGHSASFDNLLGTDRSEELTQQNCLENSVDRNTCPCFIWHTAKDTCVNVANSLVFADALTKNNICCELHIFPMGEHGLSRANAETTPDWAPREYNIPYVARWVEWSYKWLEYVFYDGRCRFNIDG